MHGYEIVWQGGGKMKKDWTKPKLISLYRGRPGEAVLNACKLSVDHIGPDDTTTIQSCEAGSNQCKVIDPNGS